MYVPDADLNVRRLTGMTSLHRGVIIILMFVRNGIVIYCLFFDRERAVGLSFQSVSTTGDILVKAAVFGVLLCPSFFCVLIMAQ